MKKNYRIREKFYDLLTTRLNASKMIRTIEHQADIYLFGGCLRDFLRNQFRTVPRDFDLVISSDTDVETFLKQVDCIYRKNKFGGYKIKVDDLNFDVWTINETWAFKTQKVELQNAKDLVKTVFLNVDGLLYDLKNCTFYDDLYRKAISDRTLDIILKDNPHPELNIARAYRLKHDYNLNFSDELQAYCNNWISQYDSRKKVKDTLKKIEHKRYKTNQVNWDDEFDQIVLK
jgi:tRNA nucleotidyltransferase/poly(A) polymerase